jgi:hypothetical protein
MKAILNQLLNGRITRWGFLPALVIAALSASAGNNYTGNGFITKMPVPPILCTDGSGQTLVRASVQTVCVQTDDPRTTGRRQMFLNAACQADGSHLIWGTGYQEVGTWQEEGKTFTPTAGLWELSYRTVMPADHCLNFKLVGVGYGGVIDGQRLEENVTRPAAADIIDHSKAYSYAGTINPAPLNTSQVFDNFDDNRLTDWEVWGNGRFFNTNQQLTVRGYYPGVHTTSIFDSYVLGAHSPSWTVPDGQTREWRVDLVSLDENATDMAILTVGTTSGLYALHKGRDFVYLLKWPASGGGMSIFACEKAAIRNSNVILALAVTRVKPNLVVTARLLDKLDPSKVMYQRIVVDTPNADPTFNAAQFRALTGMTWRDLGPDAAGAPFTSFGPALGVFQYTDGNKPAVLANFDNLELRTSEVPRVGIESAMRLTWPASASVNWSVEGAATTQGPWLPVQDSLAPGVQQVTVPADEDMKFFRLRQAP